jgi:sugar phosphate isomerase/epimerase
MSDWPVGISTGCFYYRSFFDCLEPICRGGFSMIEIASSKTHLDYHDKAAMKRAARALEEWGIEAYSFHAPFREDIDVTSLDSAVRAHARQEIFSAAEAAALLGVRYFVFHPGPEKSYDPTPQERVQRMNNAAHVINEVCEYCRELGIGIVLENMLPHLFFGNLRDMLWIVGAIESPMVGACLDTGHAFISGDLERVMYKLSGYLQFIHANDNRGQDDLHLCPGQGGIDWRKLLHELNEVDFHGAFILELMGDAKKDPYTVLNEARQARRFLRGISRGLTISNPPAVARAAPEILQGV